MRTLLLADDSVTIQRVIELTFADQDIQVVAVSDGDQAIARLESAPPDIVLADVGMPGRNGYEVARYVRNSPKLSHIPVVLLTGAFEPIDQQRADEAGCDGVLAKPFEPQLVIGRVKELLMRGAPPKQPPAPPANEAKAAEPPAAPPASPKVVRPPFASTTERYFADLDEALTKATRDPADFTLPPKPEPPPPKRVVPPTPEQSQMVEIDSFTSEADLPAQTPIDLPRTTSPAAEEKVDRKTRHKVEEQVEEEVAKKVEAIGPPAAAAHSRPFPSIADAFAALLAAEQNEPVPALPPSWPPAVPDRLLREAVAEIVSNVAEKLVREEIERIKASIK